MYQTVIGAGPEYATFQRRLREREDGAVVLGAGVVFGYRSAGGIKLRRVIARQIRTDDLPGCAFVGRPEDLVARDIQHVGVVWRDERRKGPLEAVFRIPGTGADGVLR